MEGANRRLVEEEPRLGGVVVREDHQGVGGVGVACLRDDVHRLALGPHGPAEDPRAVQYLVEEAEAGLERAGRAKEAVPLERE